MAALASGVLTAVSRRYSDQLGMTMAADLREQVIDKALRMDSATLERAGTGDVTSRVTEDVELVNTSVRVAAGVFTSLVTVVLTFVGFATLDWRLALAFLLVFPVHAFGLRRFLPAAGSAVREGAGRGRRAHAAGDERPARSRRPCTRTGWRPGRRRVVETASRRAVDAALTAIRAFFRFASTMNIAEAVGLVVGADHRLLPGPRRPGQRRRRDRGGAAVPPAVRAAGHAADVSSTTSSRPARP